MPGKNVNGRWIANPKPITSSDPTGWRDGDFGLNTVLCAEEAEEGTTDTNKGVRNGAPQEAGTNSKRVTGAYG
jgi:hypothetical protein